jgi:hypothetical protein
MASDAGNTLSWSQQTTTVAIDGSILSRDNSSSTQSWRVLQVEGTVPAVVTQIYVKVEDT